MNKLICAWSYWLGLVSAVIALGMRTAYALGFLIPGTVVQGKTIWYMSFYKAALLFFVINIATSMRSLPGALSSASTSTDARRAAANFQTTNSGRTIKVADTEDQLKNRSSWQDATEMREKGFGNARTRNR